jgi:O-antigen ligase
MHRVGAATTGGYARNRGKRRLAGVIVQACLLGASLAVGRAVVETQAIDASASQIGLTAVAIAASLVVMLWGPVPCLAAIAALTVLPLLPEVSLGGGVDLFPADAFYGALVCWWLIRVERVGTQRSDVGARGALNAGPVLLFLAYVGLTLLYVAAVDPSRLSVSFVSWLRLVETASIGWFAVAFLRTRRDVTLVLGAIALAGTIAIGLALAGAVGESDATLLGERGGGVVNPNALGLVAGLMVLMGSFGALGPSLIHRVPLALWGAVGLVQSQSVGSLVATSVALVLGLTFMVAPPRRVVAVRALRAAMALGVGVVLAYGLASVIRPENLPTSQNFRESSAGQRTVLAVAGLEIAERHPVIGVGWRRSEEPEVIGDAELNAELRARFPNTPHEYFPDVSPASVHNAYIQVVADLGLIGLGLFLLMLASLGRDINNVVKRVPRAAPERAQLWCMAWGLVLVLIWKNDNPIYGGQAETVIPVLFVGAIGGLAGTLARRARPAADRQPAG